MAESTAYATAAELQARLDTAGSWSAGETAIHTAVIAAVCRAVDRYTRRFYGTSADATAKTFTAVEAGRLVVPDLVSVSALATDEDGDQSYERTWSSTDYVLWPFNAAQEFPARPYLEIRVSEATGSNDYVFPYGQKGVRVTGVWGWPAVPGDVKEVVLLEAARMIEQTRTPSGVISNAALGTATIVPDLHPTSRRILKPYIRHSARRV